MKSYRDREKKIAPNLPPSTKTTEITLSPPIDNASSKEGFWNSVKNFFCSASCKNFCGEALHKGEIEFEKLGNKLEAEIGKKFGPGAQVIVDKFDQLVQDGIHGLEQNLIGNIQQPANNH